MARLLVAAGLVCASAALAAATGGARAQSHSLLHYGDSLAVGTGRYLPALMAGWDVKQAAKVGRRSIEAPRFLRGLEGGLPRVLLVSLGTNDDPAATAAFAATVREVVEIAGPGRCVIWSSIVRPPQRGLSYQAYNRVLAGAAREWPSFHVLDWGRMADAHPEWLRGDGVHPSSEGYRARAEALAQLARDC